MNRTRLVLSGILLLSWAVPAGASSIVFSSEGAFQAATSATLHPLTAGVNGPSVTTTDGALTLTTASQNLVTDWTTYTGVDRLAGVEMAISGPESFNANVFLGADRFAFGFGIYESTSSALAGCNFACADSTFTITLKNNSSQVGSTFSLSPADDVAVFWGVFTDYAFDAIEIRETTGTADNEIFGTFYTGTTAIPEPATLLLLGTGLGIAGIRRRLKRA